MCRLKQTLYFSCDGLGAFKQIEESEQLKLEELLTSADQLPVPANGRKFTIVGSRSHMSEETEAFINEQKEKHGEVEIASMGSSLKYVW